MKSLIYLLVIVLLFASCAGENTEPADEVVSPVTEIGEPSWQQIYSDYFADGLYQGVHDIQTAEHTAADRGMFINIGSDMPPYRNDRNPPLTDDDGTVFVALSCVGSIFRYGLGGEVDGEVVTFIQQGFEYDVEVKIEAGSNILYRNGTALTMDAAPFHKGRTLYFPIAAVADALGHYTWFNERTNELQISYTAVEIYVWNENRDSSAEGLRYAIFQCRDNERDLSEVFAGGVSDFDEIEKQFDRVPPGLIGLTPLYRIAGHKIQYEDAQAIEYRLIDSFGYVVGVRRRLIDELPLIIQGTGGFSDEWFSMQLLALGESGLKETGSHTYRFMYLRENRQPMMLRIEVMPDGSGVLHFALCDGEINDWGGELIEVTQKSLSTTQVNEFLELLEAVGFREIPLSEDTGYYMLGGAWWVIEGVRDGGYHLIERQSPEEGSDVYRIGELFVELWGGDINLY